MDEILEALTSPRAFAASLVVFAFLPGLALRLIVCLYPKGHPRRTELLGELYAMPQWRRPWFVAEQFETALCEGLPVRVSDSIDKSRRALTGIDLPKVRRATAGGVIGVALLVGPPVLANVTVGDKRMSMTAIITTGIALLAVTILAAIIIRHLPPSLSNRRESERTGQ